MTQLPASILVMLVPVVLTAGCSFSASTGDRPDVAPAELEKQVAAKAGEEGLTTDRVDCPKGLAAEVDASAACTVYANDLKYDGTVKATKVDGRTVSFDLRIPPPATVPTATLEEQARELLDSQVSGGIESVECPDELTGTVGESVDCTIQPAQGDQITVGATVTEASFANVNFSFKQK